MNQWMHSPKCIIESLCGYNGYGIKKMYRIYMHTCSGIYSRPTYIKQLMHTTHNPNGGKTVMERILDSIIVIGQIDVSWICQYVGLLQVLC